MILYSVAHKLSKGLEKGYRHVSAIVGEIRHDVCAGTLFADIAFVALAFPTVLAFFASGSTLTAGGRTYASFAIFAPVAVRADSPVAVFFFAACAVSALALRTLAFILVAAAAVIARALAVFAIAACTRPAAAFVAAWQQRTRGAVWRTAIGAVAGVAAPSITGRADASDETLAALVRVTAAFPWAAAIVFNASATIPLRASLAPATPAIAAIQALSALDVGARMPAASASVAYARIFAFFAVFHLAVAIAAYSLFFALAAVRTLGTRASRPFVSRASTRPVAAQTRVEILVGSIVENPLSGSKRIAEDPSEVRIPVWAARNIVSYIIDILHRLG